MVELTSLGVFVSIVGSTLVALIHSIQNSRCTKIQACCISCDRTLVEENENEVT